MHLLPRLVLVVALVAVAAYASPTRKPCSQPKPTCPSSSKKSTFLVDPCNCETYYECTKKGEQKSLTCQPWQNFDPKTLKCVSWYLVDCSAAPATQAPAPTAKPHDPTVPATGSPSGTTGEPSPDAPATSTVVPGCSFVPACPASGSANLGIPCADSCGKYVACKDGSYTVEKCGFFFPKFDIVSGECKRWKVTCAA